LEKVVALAASGGGDKNVELVESPWLRIEVESKEVVVCYLEGQSVALVGLLLGLGRGSFNSSILMGRTVNTGGEARLCN
jgi:hypothetical protein